MAKVTYSSAKGLVVESGTGFQVNDAPVLEEIEAVSPTTGVAETINNYGITSVTSPAADAGCELTLPDGDAAGQLKTVVLATAGGDEVQVTGTNSVGAAQQLCGDNLKAAGDYMHLLWTGAAWATVSEVTSA